MLVAQHSDWRSFREFQKRIRRYYLPPKCFHRFQNEARDRRRRHALEGEVCLQHDPAKQTQMENWVEFQNFHLTIHERFEKEVMEENEYLIAAQKKSAAKAQGAEEVEIFKARLKTGESKVMHHELLLHWTEQQRKAMAVEHMPSINNTRNEWSDELKTYWGDFIDGRRKRPPKARPLLNPVQSGVSKNKLRQRSPRSQRRISQEAHNKSLSRHVSQQGISLPPTVQEKRSSCSKESTPLRPRKVSRIAKRKLRSKQIPKTNAKIRQMSLEKRGRQQKPTKHGQCQRQKSLQQSVCVAVKTQSGRVSKRPERFCPG